MIEQITTGECRLNFPDNWRHLEKYFLRFFAFRTGCMAWRDLTTLERTFYSTMACCWDAHEMQIQVARLQSF